MGIPELEASAWVAIGVGAGLLAFGWLLYNAALAVVGAVVGGLFGYAISQVLPLFIRLPPGYEMVIVITLTVVGVIVGIVIFHTVHRLAFFLAGAGSGGWLAAEATQRLQEQNYPWAEELWFIVFAPIVGAIVLGFVATAFSNYVIVLATCAGGTILIMEALDWPGGGVYGLILFPLGLIVQTLLVRRREKKSRDDD